MTPGDLPLFLVSSGVYLERDGKILILERAAGAMIGFWSLPSGLLDAGEMPEDGARRELFEEAGLRPAGPLTLVARSRPHDLRRVPRLARPPPGMRMVQAPSEEVLV